MTGSNQRRSREFAGLTETASERRVKRIAESKTAYPNGNDASETG